MTMAFLPWPTSTYKWEGNVRPCPDVECAHKSKIRISSGSDVEGLVGDIFVRSHSPPSCRYTLEAVVASELTHAHNVHKFFPIYHNHTNHENKIPSTQFQEDSDGEK